jgi:predicted metal-dependent enzyme (double-stranded beta helix superfamily)
MATTTATFDIDAFLSECRAAAGETEPRLAVREVLSRAMSAPGRVAEALAATRAAIVPLYAADDLSVLHVVWAPGMRLRPHNHLMWAAIGLYGGQEDNTFYRREGPGITVSGARQLGTGDVALLGDDTIHAVTNPRRGLTGAIHVYGGDLTTRLGRSEWEDGMGAEGPYDFERTKRYFDEANALD